MTSREHDTVEHGRRSAWWAVAMALAVVFAPLSAHADFEPVPEDDEFVPFMCDGEPAWDPHQDDQADHRDIVGDEDRPAALRAATDDYLYLRLRLDGDPRKNDDDLKPFGWGFLFDVPPLNFEDDDPDTNTYDYLLHLNGTPTPDELTFHSNDGQDELDDPTAEAAGEIEWTRYHDDPDPVWHVKEATGEAFGDEPTDWFLTVGISWEDLTPYGIEPDGVTVLWFGTTTSNNSIDRDFACHDADDGDPAMSDFPSDGQTLDPDVDPCEAGTDECSDDSTCVDEGDGDYSCDCDPGYTGEYCEIADPCADDANNDCSDNSTCVDEGDGDYSCDCDPGYTGEYCDTPDPCFDDADNDCHDDAVCTSDADGYECECRDGFVGDGTECTLVVAITEPQDGDVVRNSTPTVTGTGEPGSTVVIYVDGEQVGTAEVDEDGNWSWTPDEPMEDGEVTVTAESTSEEGITSADSTTFTIDTDIEGVVITTEDGTTFEDDTPTVEGTAEPNSEVEVFVDGDYDATVTADDNGNWSWTPDEAMEDGTYEISARYPADAPGDGDSIDIEIESTGPVVSVDSPKEDEHLEPGTIIISGEAEPGAEVTVYVNGEKVGTTTADEDGNWEMEYEAEPGEDQDVEVVAEDDEGNTSTDERNFSVMGVYDATGGGGLGCAAAPGGVGAWLVVVMMILVVGFRRRRSDRIAGGEVDRAREGRR